MTAPSTAQASSPARDLASRIYVELVGRSAGADGGAKLLANAEALAMLSLKLAEAFIQAEDKADTARKPKAAFELNASSIASWTPATPPAKP